MTTRGGHIFLFVFTLVRWIVKRASDVLPSTVWLPSSFVLRTLRRASRGTGQRRNALPPH